jgi:AcrR family transcriptional regulator
MAQAVISKREQNTARTREKLVDAAVQLYGDRSIDGVSLREISMTAGQKNSNALQYHFADKDGLLQAIVDKHAWAITDLRVHYIQRAEKGEWPLGEACRTLSGRADCSLC